MSQNSGHAFFITDTSRCNTNSFQSENYLLLLLRGLARLHRQLITFSIVLYHIDY
jgi:hypothetical protein